jgi:hypothetical protein
MRAKALTFRPGLRHKKLYLKIHDDYSGFNLPLANTNKYAKIKQQVALIQFFCD